MKNYMILLFILQLIFILQGNAGLLNYLCFGLCMSPSLVFYIRNPVDPLALNHIDADNRMRQLLFSRCSNVCFDEQPLIANA